MHVRHVLEHVSGIVEWLDVVELGGGDEGADRGPAVGAPVGSGKTDTDDPESCRRWSSISLTVSPIRCSLPPQQGQSWRWTSKRTSSRGRCAGRLDLSSCVRAVLVRADGSMASALARSALRSS